MSQTTTIVWCDSTANQMMGCGGCQLWNSKVRHCYAGKLVEKYAGNKGWPKSFDQPAIFPERILEACKWPDLLGKDRKGKPWLNGLPRLIFLDDMGDTFTEGLPIDWLMPYIPKMQDSSHIWIFLTKRPKRMARFFEMLGYVPANFWLGVSVTDQGTANALIPELLKIPAAIRLLSVEPQLGPIDFRDWIGPEFLIEKRIHWVINGGESGPGFRRFDWDWARKIRNYCEIANIPYFCKQGGGYPSKREALFEIPEDLRIREMPIEPMQNDTPAVYQPELL